MNTAELKNRIQSFVDKADDRVLSIVNSVFEHYYQDETPAGAGLRPVPHNRGNSY